MYSGAVTKQITKELVFKLKIVFIDNE